jgi:hypothetical protein
VRGQLRKWKRSVCVGSRQATKLQQLVSESKRLKQNCSDRHFNLDARISGF